MPPLREKVWAKSLTRIRGKKMGKATYTVTVTNNSAEIEQLEWVHPSEARDDMAPLNIVHVFPALLASTRPFQ